MQNRHPADRPRRSTFLRLWEPMTAAFHYLPVGHDCAVATADAGVMLQRSPSPDAARARRSRARLKVGVRTFRVQAHSRRLIAAMRKANPALGDDDLNQQTIEAELDDIVAAFCDRGLGPAKKPPAEACRRTRCAPPRGIPTATYCAGAPSDYRGAHQRHHRVLSPLMVVADHRGVVSKILEGQWSRRPPDCRPRSAMTMTTIVKVRP